MRHALAMFSFCLLMPSAACACMPMEGAMGTQGAVSLVSFFLFTIMMFMCLAQSVQIVRLTKGSPARASLGLRRRATFRLGMLCILLSIMTLFVDSVAIAVAALLAVFLYKIVLPTLAWLVRQGANALHSIKIAGEKASSTRRLTAAGDVQ